MGLVRVRNGTIVMGNLYYDNRVLPRSSVSFRNGSNNRVRGEGRC